MSEKDKKDIQEMVETAQMLAEHDPQALLIAKSNIDILKARCEIARANEQTEKAG